MPAGDGTSLYLRPAMIASEPFLGVRPAKRYLFFVIASPAGSYYDDERPLRIRVEDRYVRAAQGGVGAAKTGANYAASLLAAEEAHRDGFDQVLWLDERREYLEEAGTMNVMLRLGDEVVTPPLGGTILPGVIRDSVLRLLSDWGIPVTERRNLESKKLSPPPAMALSARRGVRARPPASSQSVSWRIGVKISSSTLEHQGS